MKPPRTSQNIVTIRTPKQIMALEPSLTLAAIPMCQIRKHQLFSLLKDQVKESLQKSFSAFNANLTNSASLSEAAFRHLCNWPSEWSKTSPPQIRH